MKNKDGYLKLKKLLEFYVEKNDDIIYHYDMDVVDILDALKRFDTQIERSLVLEIVYNKDSNLKDLVHSPQNTIDYIKATNGVSYNDNETIESIELGGIYEEIFKCILDGKEPIIDSFETYVDTDNHNLELHSTTILDNKVFNVYDIEIKDYLYTWDSREENNEDITRLEE